MKHIIEPERYYRPSEIIEMHPVLRAKGRQYFYKLIKRMQPDRFIDTNHGGRQPSYIIKGEDLEEFISQFDRSLQ